MWALVFKSLFLVDGRGVVASPFAALGAVSVSFFVSISGTSGEGTRRL